MIPGAGLGGAVAVLVFDFDPYLRLGDYAVRWETLGAAAAILVGLVLAAVLAGRIAGDDRLIGEDPLIGEDEALVEDEPWHLRRDDLLFIALGAVPGAVILGRLGYGLLHADYYAGDWRALLDPAQGSLELALAVIGGTLTGIYVAALLDAPVGRWLHAAIVPLLVALGLGKASMALGGSGQGAGNAGTWSTAYLPPGPWGSPGAAIPAHPSQLLEALVTLAVLIVVVILARLTPLRRADGRLYAVGVGLWALGRGLAASTWRDPAVVGGLNAGQLICLGISAAMFGIAALATVVRMRRPAGPIVPAA